VVFKWQILLNALVAAGESFILAYYFQHFLGKHFKKQWIYIVVYTCYFGINFQLSQFVIRQKMIPYVTIFIYFCIAFFLYNGTKFQKCFAVGLLLAYAFITEALFTVFTSWLSGHALPRVPKFDFIYFLMMILSRCIFFSMVAITAKRRSTLLTSGSAKHRIASLSIVIVCVILSYVDMFSLMHSSCKTLHLHLLSESAILALSVTAFSVFEKFQESTNKEIHISLLKQQLQLGEKYFKSMDTNRTELYAIKHDFSNHLISIKHLLLNHKYKDLKKYIKQYLDDVDHVISETITGCSSFDALISIKKQIAIKKAIHFSCEIRKISTLYINPVHLNILLGNLLDNAIEACERLPEEAVKTIILKLRIEENHFYFEIINSSLALSNLPHTLLTTTKRDPLHHGFGLNISKNLVEQYGGDILWKYKDGRFSVMASLKNVEQPVRPGMLYASNT
jgi:hypothetical protein